MARKQPTFDIEAYTNGQWLWVILPAYKTREAAQADADRMTAQNGTPHRVTES